MSYTIKENSLSYDDVLLEPKFSTITTRSSVDLSVRLGGYTFQHPVIPANMKTITGKDMAIEVIKSGGLAILHRFMTMDEQLEAVEACKSTIANGGVGNFAVSVGVKDSDEDNVEIFLKRVVKNLCIDIAHGDSSHCLSMINFIKNFNLVNKDRFIIAGNVATRDAAKRLWLAGADAVKVGIGPGSLCTTRIETGNGVPQLSAIIEISKERESLKQFPPVNPMYIIADGGIKSAGDVVKALCFADMVMVGNMFSGCVETPGDVVSIDGGLFKEYSGSSTHKSSHVEGVTAMVPCKGTYTQILTKIVEGVKSGLSYQGAPDLKKLKENVVLVKITQSGLMESKPHNKNTI
jgi:IMP dehydrogenase